MLREVKIPRYPQCNLGPDASKHNAIKRAIGSEEYTLIDIEDTFPTCKFLVVIVETDEPEGT